MRVQMWCDMEGVAGITKWDQVNAGASQYEEGRLLYTMEVNAAVRGAKRAGAKEIIVVDGHGAGGDHTFNSWRKDLLEPGAEYVTGHRWSCYVEPLREGCDAMLMPCAHAMAGTPDAVLSHTMATQAWLRAEINGREVGECGIIAAIAGSFDVPVVFVSGDTQTCAEVTNLLGDGVVQAPVKRGLGRFAARSLAPDDACKLIEEKVAEALAHPERWPAPWKLDSPVEIRVELNSPDQAVPWHGRAGVTVESPRVVSARGKTAWEAWDLFWKR